MNELTLGRSGMGSDSEEEFDAWVAFVMDNIDEATGLDVAVKAAGVRDIQNDVIISDDEGAKEVIKEVIQTLWDQFCSKM